MFAPPTATRRAIPAVRALPVSAGMVLGAVLLFTARAWPAWETLVDDAYISARYAEMLAHGHGLTYSADAAPVEGFTNFAWTVLLATFRLFGAPIGPTMTGLGWAFGVAAIVVAWPLTRTLSQRDTPINALPSWLLAISPHLAVASTNGLESSMMVFAVLLATWLHLTDDTPSRWRAGLAMGLLICTRPEGAAVAAGLVAHAVATHRTDVRGWAPTLAWAAGWLGALTAFRLGYYGLALPNTWFAKQSFPIAETWRVNDQYIKPDQTTLTAAALLLIGASVVRPWRLDRALLTVLAIGLAVIPLNVYLWMPGLRLFLPSMALTFVLAGSALASWRLWTGAVGAVVVLGAALGVAREADERAYAYDGRHSVLYANGTEQAARWIGDQLDPGAWVATRDAGVFAYFVGPHVHVAELHQRALTRPHPEGKDAPVQDYTPRNPEIIVVTQRRERTQGFVYGNDRRVLTGTTEPYRYLGRVHQHYHRYYDLYARADLDLVPLPEDLVISRAGPMPPKPAD